MTDRESATYTTAPESYDGFGTTTVCAAVGHLNGGTPVRQVWTPPEHVGWQRQRYLSGWMYLVADADKWDKLLATGAAVAADGGAQ